MQKNIISLSIIGLLIGGFVISEKCIASPITAREVFTDVNSAALSIADDAQLMLVFGGGIDTTGRSNGWSYVYKSASLQKIYELRVADGEVRQLENCTFELGPDPLPIGEEWIDSNEAVAISEENGGKDTRETYEDVEIEMGLESEWVNPTEVQPVWQVRYRNNALGGLFLHKVIAGPTMSILGNPLFPEDPVVENVRFEQRTDGTGLVDIYYDVTDWRGYWLEIIIEASDDNGATWTLPCTSLTGDVGEAVRPGTDKHVVWDFSADNPNTSSDGVLVHVTAYRMLCGQTITEDFTLTEDLRCPPGTPYAIIIGAPNITLDLGGHTIYGDVPNDCPTAVGVHNVEGVTIKNGTLEGFLGAIDLVDANNATVEDMTIKNLDIADPKIQVTGIIVGNSQDVIIRDSQFEFLYIYHKGGINMANSHVDVNNIEQHGGGTVVDFGNSSSGSVVNSRFIGQYGAGILVQSCNGVRIANNVFENSSIIVDPAIQGIIRGVIIEENDIHDCGSGILILGASGVIVSNNIISNNVMGITLEPSRGCGGDYGEAGVECFYATGNVITDNVVLGNGIDLYHHEQCIGNTWEGNTYETVQGSELYTYGPATAREGLAAVNSAAADVAADAELIFVASRSCDTTGKSYTWFYIYKSVGQQSYYEFRYHYGQVMKQDSVTILWMISENNLPLPESWIDSDEAVAIADNQGGKEFRETHELKHIEMNIAQTHSLTWTVWYISEDGNFISTFIDASVE